MRKYILLLALTGPAWGCAEEHTTVSDPIEIEISGSSSAAADEPFDEQVNTEIVQEDVRTLLEASYSGDVKTVLHYSHPAIIDMMGGAAKAEVLVTEILSKAQEVGLQSESLTFPETPTFLETDQHHFAIVPTLSIMSANGQRVESLNFQFGIKDKGSESWKYMEGSRVESHNLLRFFPDFPADYTFPAFYRKRIPPLANQQ